jgi:hypothetical protein
LRLLILDNRLFTSLHVLQQGARLEREEKKKRKKRETKKKKKEKMNLSHIEYEQTFFTLYFYKKAT